MADPTRLGALDAVAESRLQVALAPLPPAARFIFRGRQAALELAGMAFAVPLPQEACRAREAGGRAALWLGPDEWLILAEEGAGEAIAAALEAALEALPHSLVEVSQRQAGLAVGGPRAAAALNAGCPLDLDLAAFPVGMCTRTILGKAEIVLWRRAPEAFRVEVARSFARYAWDFLSEARREHEV